MLGAGASTSEEPGPALGEFTGSAAEVLPGRLPCECPVLGQKRVPHLRPLGPRAQDCPGLRVQRGGGIWTESGKMSVWPREKPVVGGPVRRRKERLIQSCGAGSMRVCGSRGQGRGCRAGHGGRGLLQAPEKGDAAIRTGCRCLTLVST